MIAIKENSEDIP